MRLLVLLVFLLLVLVVLLVVLLVLLLALALWLRCGAADLPPEPRPEVQMTPQCR